MSNPGTVSPSTRQQTENPEVLTFATTLFGDEDGPALWDECADDIGQGENTSFAAVTRFVRGLDQKHYQILAAELHFLNDISDSTERG